MSMKRIVETDNHGGDYPDEKFLPIPLMPQFEAHIIANNINRGAGRDATRFWKVVEPDYVLQPGFEP